MACLIFSQANHSLQSWVRIHHGVRKEWLSIFGASGRKFEINCATQSPLVLIFLKVFTQHACHQKWAGTHRCDCIEIVTGLHSHIILATNHPMMAKIEIEGIDLPEQNTC